MNATLLVLAAGMATRYGSLKQIDKFAHLAKASLIILINIITYFSDDGKIFERIRIKNKKLVKLNSPAFLL